MLKKLSLLILISVTTILSQQGNTLLIYPAAGKDTISRNIYGQFSEHLGRCIYGGIWVGENSSIPNTRGIRNDVVKALREINVPCLRWPGGCFADTYHWKDGIGPRDKRPKIINSSWGGVTEDNSFGTHEFMDFCEQVGCEPVICGNVGSGTVKEMADWVEYLTSDTQNPMSELRKKNGREKPWKVKFWGVGNESWGCGGIMDAKFYSNILGKYSFFLKDYGKNTLYKIASGGLEDDYYWTETLMKKWSKVDGWLKNFMSGYSLHYYTVCHDWDHKGSATDFNEDEWITTLSKTQRMDTLINNHSAIMDRYDPEKKIGLVVDEWGDWFDVEPGTNSAFLYQQNTLRDAMVASINLDIFNKHCGRVKMANIAQMVNVLQALILTRKEKMILTPTYYVFDLYKVHHDAVFLPFNLVSEDYGYGGKKISSLYATASRNSSGLIHISITNVNPEKKETVSCNIAGITPKQITGKILTSDKMQDHNTFNNPDKINIKDFNGFKINGDNILIDMPSKSIITLEIKD